MNVCSQVPSRRNADIANPTCSEQSGQGAMAVLKRPLADLMSQSAISIRKIEAAFIWTIMTGRSSLYYPPMRRTLPKLSRVSEIQVAAHRMSECSQDIRSWLNLK
jgi:hypothetical protein